MNEIIQSKKIRTRFLKRMRKNLYKINFLYKLISPIELYISSNFRTRSCYFFPEINAIFYHLPKSAGKSIISSFEKHYSYINMTKRKASKINAFRFVFMRESLSRLKSAWKFTILYKNFRERFNLKKDCSFEEWIGRTRKNKLTREFHVKTFNELFGDINFDFIGRFENINKDFKKLTKILKIKDIELKKINTYEQSCRMIKKIEDAHDS